MKGGICCCYLLPFFCNDLSGGKGKKKVVESR